MNKQIIENAMTRHYQLQTYIEDVFLFYFVKLFLLFLLFLFFYIF